ncbi:MAG: SGNH/GDSL hydrolase family protein [Candidatus Omnitrophica bacterium]|nr:SGNH/GDSL hydrolase family protein [Candidatus Omnitrophota bacterium]
MKFLKNILISLFISVIVFMLVEIPFRVYDYEFKYKNLKSWFYQGKIPISFEEIMVYHFKTGRVVRDPDLIWRHKYSEEHPLDSIGIRTCKRKEISCLKDCDVYRIIIFGGSHPFGLYLKYEDTYAYRLEELFRNKQREWDKKIQVINASIPGYSTLQALNLLKYHMIHYNPDLVIIDAGNNDGLQLCRSWPWRDSEIVGTMSTLQCRVLNILEKSSFFWYFREFLYKIKHSIIVNKNKVNDIELTRVSKEENKNNLEEIKKLAYSNNFKVIFLSQVTMDGVGQLRRGFGAVVEPYLDIYGKLKNRSDIKDYFLDSIHGSAKGHREIAKIIYDYLKADIMQSELKK